MTPFRYFVYFKTTSYLVVFESSYSTSSPVPEQGTKRSMSKDSGYNNKKISSIVGFLSIILIIYTSSYNCIPNKTKYKLKTPSSMMYWCFLGFQKNSATEDLASVTLMGSALRTRRPCDDQIMVLPKTGPARQWPTTSIIFMNVFLLRFRIGFTYDKSSLSLFLEILRSETSRSPVKK